jgi:hypothetical protein
VAGDNLIAYGYDFYVHSFILPVRRYHEAITTLFHHAVYLTHSV